MMNLTVAPCFGSGLLAVVLLILLAGILFLVPIRDDRLSPFRRKILTAVRLAVWVLFGICLFRPAVIIEENTSLPAALLIAADTSESMSAADGPGETSRYEVMKKTLDDAAEKIDALAQSGSAAAFSFDSEPSALEIENGHLSLPSKPAGKETKIGASLTAVLSQTAGKRVSGLILFSDGTQRSLSSNEMLVQDAAFRFRDAGVTIWPVLLGESEEGKNLRDLSVQEMTLPGKIFAGNTFSVNGIVRASGLASEKIKLKLNLENEQGGFDTVEEQEIAVDQAEAAIPYQFFYTPAKPGEWKITVEAETVPGETQTFNNIKSDFIEVVEGGVSVLCLEGTPRYEQKFIRMALESSAEVRTDYERITPDRTVDLDGKTEVQRIAAQTAARPSMVEKYFTPNRYAGYILGDIDSSAFKSEELKALADRVREGAGLILLAGERAFAAGGYAETPLADLFPVELPKSMRVPVDRTTEEFFAAVPEEARPFRDRAVTMAPTELGSGHYLTQLSVDEAKNREIWKKLPALGGYWVNGRVKPGAEVLTQAADSAAEPLLVIEPFGLGRVALVAVDSTWRWALGGFAEEQQRFWRQLVLWSADEDSLPDGTLSILTDKRRFHETEPFDFQIQYRPKKGEAEKNYTVKAEISLPDGQKVPIPLSSEKSDFIACYGQFSQTVQPGDYKMSVTVSDDTGGESAAAKECRFLVEMMNLELDRPGASPAVLHSLAAATGGEVIKPDQFPELLDRLKQNQTELLEKREIRKTLYDSWLLFVLFTLLVSTEWFLRKRWGLV